MSFTTGTNYKSGTLLQCAVYIIFCTFQHSLIILWCSGTPEILTEKSITYNYQN